jgi:hypothetical protein
MSALPLIRSAVAVAAVAVSTAAVPHLSAQDAPFGEVLSRTVQWVLEYQEQLAGVVSEEMYVQTWEGRTSRGRETRTLKSDVLLTRPPGATRYLLFRDVFEVDGRRVRDRDERLLQLFLQPSPVASRQVLRILDESARYNIGDISRNVNTPTLALVFLDPQYRERFRFERTGDLVPETVREAATPGTDDARKLFTAPEGLWAFTYQETGLDTMLGTGNGDSLRTSGRFWVEPATGRVVMTELELRAESVTATVDVRYHIAPELGLMVPVAMRERYEAPRTKSLVEGTAVYTRVRRFQVSATEAIGDPQEP